MAANLKLAWREIRIDPLLNAGYDGRDVLTSTLKARNVRATPGRQVGVWVKAQRGVRTLAGALGAEFMPDQSGQLTVMVLVSSDERPDPQQGAYACLPRALAQRVLDGALAVEEIAALGAGVLRFDRAWLYPGASTFELFSWMAGAVVRLLVPGLLELPDEELAALLEVDFRAAPLAAEEPPEAAGEPAGRAGQPPQEGGAPPLEAFTVREEVPATGPLEKEPEQDFEELAAPSAPEGTERGLDTLPLTYSDVEQIMEALGAGPEADGETEGPAGDEEQALPRDAEEGEELAGAFFAAGLDAASVFASTPGTAAAPHDGYAPEARPDEATLSEAGVEPPGAETEVEPQQAPVPETGPEFLGPVGQFEAEFVAGESFPENEIPDFSAGDVAEAVAVDDLVAEFEDTEGEDVLYDFGVEFEEADREHIAPEAISAELIGLEEPGPATEPEGFEPVVAELAAEAAVPRQLDAAALEASTAETVRSAPVLPVPGNGADTSGEPRQEERYAYPPPARVRRGDGDQVTRHLCAACGRYGAVQVGQDTYRCLRCHAVVEYRLDMPPHITPGREVGNA